MEMASGLTIKSVGPVREGSLQKLIRDAGAGSVFSHASRIVSRTSRWFLFWAVIRNNLYLGKNNKIIKISDTVNQVVLTTNPSKLLRAKLTPRVGTNKTKNSDNFILVIRYGWQLWGQ